MCLIHIIKVFDEPDKHLRLAVRETVDMHTTQAMKQMMKYSELLEERIKFENEVPASILKKM